jgi:hypothetical protein
MSAFFGNMLISLKTGISATTLSAVANATTSSLTASVSGGRGTYTYSWVLSGVGCTITSPTAATTTFTGSSVTGNTSVYCAITDTITGNTLITPTCGITWTAIPISQNVVISGGPVTYNGVARAYTLTGTPASPAPSGTPSSFVDAGTYVYPTNISITPGSGYTLGSVTGNFVISPASISGTTTNPTLTFNGSQQSAVVITSVSPAGATYSGSLTASGTNAGSYTSSVSGTGNYTGTISGGTLTINPLSISGTATNATLTFNNSQQSAVVITGVSPAGATYSGSLIASGTNAGSYTSSITGTGNYTGSVGGGTLTINRAPISGTPASSSFVYDGTLKSATVITNVSPAAATYTGSLTTSGTNAGSYTSSITGSVNYTGTVSGGTLTISRVSIGSMSFTLNGSPFTSAVSRTAGTSYTIAVLSSSVTPSLATYSPSSLTASTAGTYSLTSSGTGNYQGSFTSPVLTITAVVVVSGSINETNRFTAWSVQLTATLTGATATGYAWSRIGGTWGGAASISPSGGNPVTATVSSSAPSGSNTIFQCIISYSGGTFTATRTIPWGLI